MAPLFLSLSCFLTLFLVNKFILKDKLSLSLIGRISLSFMLIFTGLAHFTKTAEMIRMMPGFLVWKEGLVYLTGILELSAAAGLLIPKLSRATSMLLILFFIVILPANIIGSIKQVPLGGMEKGVHYLYFRIPLQLFFIWWTYYFGIRKNNTRK